jgi:hypothetical protein
VTCKACGFDEHLPTTYVGELSIPISWPSQNQLGGNARGTLGWHYRRLRQEFAAALHGALSVSPIPKAAGKRRVWLTRYYRPGKRDYDKANLIGGAKGVIDVLVTRGLLLDDSPKHFEGIFSQKPGDIDLVALTFHDVVP